MQVYHIPHFSAQVYVRPIQTVKVIYHRPIAVAYPYRPQMVNVPTPQSNTEVVDSDVYPRRSPQKAISKPQDEIIKLIKPRIIALIPREFGTPEQLNELDVETLIGLHQANMIKKLAELTMELSKN